MSNSIPIFRKITTNSRRALRATLAFTVTAVLAFAATPATAVTTSDGLVDVVITHTNPNPDNIYAVGDVLTFDLSVTNLDDETRALSVQDSNLEGRISACKWRAAAANVAQSCNGFATHTVTQADLEAGSFTPQVTYQSQAVNYTGDVLNSLEQISGDAVTITQSQLELVSFTLLNPQDSYAPGDTLDYRIRIRSLSSETINVGVTDSSFDALTSQCNWKNLAPGNGAVYNCKTVSHTLTEADGVNGSWTPVITITAIHAANGTLLQTLSGTGETIPVTVEHPQAEPTIAPDADPSVEAFMTEAVNLSPNTSTDNYRIPAITTAPNGDLLVSYDERPKDNGNGGGDAPNPNSIVQRRSIDDGKTWLSPTYIARGTETGSKVGYSDPSYVVDWETGAIYNFHVLSYDQGFGGSLAGTDPSARNVLQAHISVSTDNGYTWTHRIITAEITPDASVISRFAASGQGIQIEHGEYAGRLVQQFTVKNDAGMQAVSIFSDDHGQTWQSGTPAGTGMDENKVVELSDGTLMLNSRVSDGSGYRKIAYSYDGGQTWTEPENDPQLPDSVDNAQIIRAYPNAAPDSAEAKVLLLSHSPNPTPWSRNQGTISFSCDDGASWSSARIFNEDFVGYTTLAVQANGTLGLLSEDQRYGGIFYRNFSLAWVGGTCASIAAEEVSVERGTTMATARVSISNGSGEALAGELSLDLPLGWEAETVPVVGIGAGESKTVSITLALPDNLAEGSVSIPVLLQSATGATVQGLLTVQITDPARIASKHLSIVDVSSANSGGGADRPAENVLDGDVSTFWHSAWADGVAEAPHHLTFQLDEAYELSTLSYLPRQDGNLNGVAQDYEVRVAASVEGSCVSEDVQWENAAAGTLSGTDAAAIDFDSAVLAECVQFVILTDQGTQGDFGSAAEIWLSGSLPEQPGDDAGEDPTDGSTPSTGHPPVLVQIQQFFCGLFGRVAAFVTQIWQLIFPYHYARTAVIFGFRI